MTMMRMMIMIMMMMMMMMMMMRMMMMMMEAVSRTVTLTQWTLGPPRLRARPKRCAKAAAPRAHHGEAFTRCSRRCAVQCSVVWCGAVQCGVVQCGVFAIVPHV